MKTLAALAMTAMFLIGCEKDEPQNPVDVQTQTQRTTATSRETTGPAMEAAGGTYTRNIKHYRIFDFSGPATGDTIQSVKPFEQKGLALPTFDPNTGLLIGATQKEFKGGENKELSWLKGLWNSIKMWVYGYILLVIIALVLAVIPTTAVVGVLLLRILLFFIPGIGATLELAFGKKNTATATAASDFNFRGWTQTAAAINAYRLAHPELWEELKLILKSKQDKDIQDAIDNMNTPGATP